jgi:hypothetical protein
MGGALAGAIMAGSASGGTVYSPAATPGARSSGPVRVTFGLFFLLGGIVFLGLAGVMAYDTWKITQWVPTEVTAPELIKAKDPKAYPGPWIAYTFEGSKPTEMNVTRQRLNHGGDVEARLLLVQVEDKWMFASVAPGFEGNRLVGRISPLDPVQSKPLIERLKKIEPNPAALLPYEFLAVDGCQSDQRQRFTIAGVCAFLGLLGVIPGILLCRKRRAA